MTKNIIISILILLLVAAGWWIFNSPSQSPSPIERQARETVRIEVERLSREVDKKGIETVIMEEAGHVLTQAGIRNSTDSAGVIDSLQKLANNRLISYTQAKAEIKRLEAAMDETDTSFTYRDKWLSVAVTKPLGGKPALLNSTYNAELNWMWYDERKRLLGIPYDTRTYGRFWLNDPNATITGLKHIRIEPPISNFGLSIMAVGEYYKGDILMGGGISADIGRFRIQGNYVHDFRTGDWYPAFRGGFKLIDLK